MSCVTSLMLSCGCGEDDNRDDPIERPRLSPALQVISDYCEATRALQCLPKEVDTVSGGYKWLQAIVYAWGANYLNTEAFLKVVRDAPWENPDHVQVFVKEEEEEVWRMLGMNEIRRMNLDDLEEDEP